MAQLAPLCRGFSAALTRRVVIRPTLSFPAVSLHTSSYRRLRDITTTEDFQEHVLQSGKPVVVDFHAGWCGPCRILGPVLDEVVSSTNGKAELVKIDVDEAADIAMQYNVSSIPAVFIFRDGKVTEQFVGVRSKKEVEGLIVAEIAQHEEKQ